MRIEPHMPQFFSNTSFWKLSRLGFEDDDDFPNKCLDSGYETFRPLANNRCWPHADVLPQDRLFHCFHEWGWTACPNRLSPFSLPTEEPEEPPLSNLNRVRLQRKHRAHVIFVTIRVGG
jgi:hypothetical protein